jgi:RNA polymerase-binding protein DksA
MNKRELKKFEKMLQEERVRLTEGVRRLEEDTLYKPASDMNVSDLSSYAEVGTDNFERETALRLTSNEANMLKDIEDALDRVANGTYGICEGSGKPIPKKRLEAFPAARYCIEYQEQLERERGGRG